VNSLKSYLVSLALVGVLYLGTVQISFGQNLVLNGDFSQTSGSGQIDSNVTVQDWSANGGYNFIFVSPNVGDQNVTGSDGALSLWGPKSGSDNGLTAPPGGGNIVANDGAYEIAPLNQTMHGLTNGQTYAVTFEWAGAQQTNFDGPTTESWTVSLGSQSQTTITANNVDKGFTGWMSQTFDFTASGTTEVLSFLANGTPDGEPPFSLLADVTMVAVPEPKVSAGGMILFALLILFGTRAWRQYQRKSSTNV